MIVIFPMKEFTKKISKIVGNVDRGYLICDATASMTGDDKDSTAMGQFKNMAIMDLMAPRKEVLDKSGGFTGRSQEELLKEFFASYEFLRGSNSILLHQARYPDVNIFIVYKVKVYQKLAKRIAQEIQNYAGDQKIVFTYDEYIKDKKILYKELKDEEFIKKKTFKALKKIYKRKMRISKTAEVDDEIILKSDEKKKKKKEDDFFEYMGGFY